MGILFVIATAAPTDIVSSHPLARELVQFMAELFPRVRYYLSATGLSELNAFFWSVALLMAPLQLGTLVPRILRDADPRAFVERMRAQPSLVRVLLVILSPFLPIGALWSLFALGGDPEWCNACTTDSRLGLGLIGSVFTVALAVVAAAAILVIKNARNLLARA